MERTFRMLLKPEELSAVRAIAAQIWPITFQPILTPEQITYMMHMMYDPEVMEKELASGIYFELLELDHQPAGYVSYGKYSIPDTVKLHKVYLLKPYHHQGHGSAMLRHVMLAARQMGAKYLRLNVNKHNEQAIKAYTANGFATIESVKNDIGHGFFMDDFVMQKTL